MSLLFLEGRRLPSPPVTIPGPSLQLGPGVVLTPAQPATGSSLSDSSDCSTGGSRWLLELSEPDGDPIRVLIAEGDVE